MVDLEAVEAFWKTPLGEELRRQSEQLRRELEFTARFSQSELDELVGKSGESSLKEEFVVVQGVADLVLMLPKEILVIDFKTDAVSGREVKERAKTYGVQMRLYARALERIYGKRVSRAALYFLSARRLEEIELGDSVLSQG
jgi:ATP-dependent helicase/nuclease subunit A